MASAFGCLLWTCEHATEWLFDCFYSSAELDQFPADRVDHGLEPVVRAQFLIDVVKMIPERLGTDPQVAHDGRWAPAFGEIPKHSMFLLRQSRYRLRSYRGVRGLEELLRRSQHPLHERLGSFPISNAAHQVHDPAASRLRILVNHSRHIHPYPLA